MNVYDFDKTIFDRDSTFAFYRWCAARYPSVLLEVPGTVRAWARHYLLHKGSKTEFKQRMYRFLRRIPGTEQCVERFWRAKKGGVQSWYLMQKAQSDVIISASPEFLICPIGRELGVRVIASRVDPRTGVYEGENCHGEEKVRRFRLEYPKDEVDEFYSDSLSDTPMARLAKRAYLVNRGRLREWRI